MLSETKKHILNGLRAYGMKDEGIAMVTSMLRKPEAEEEMLDWLLEGEPESTRAILNKAIELRGKYGD